MKVAKKCCNQCPWLPNSKTVRPGRLDAIKQDLLRRDTHFICHKSLAREDKAVVSEDGYSLIRKEEVVVCRGGYDFHHGQLIRIAHRLNVIQFVDVETGEP